MKHITLFLTISVLFSLLLGSVGVYAQAPEPSERFPISEREHQPPEYDRVWLLDGKKPFLRTTSAGSQNLAPTIALGQPGLSFRYVRTFGKTEKAYLADNIHLNRPLGLTIDANKVYVVEEAGSRMLKYNSSGTHLMSIGTAGLHKVDEEAKDVFNWPKDVTLDSSKNIWVVDDQRISQYDSSGNFLQVFPDWDDDPWRCADDNGHFCWPHGIAFDSGGNLYVSDTDNHRVQVFSLSGGTPVYSTTVGVTSVSGSDNAHFNRPTQIVIDSSDNLYVADADNFRVQVCTYAAGWSCSNFHGTGSQGSGNNELGWWVSGLGKDGSDNIYIADSDNDRVKKCTSAGSCSIFKSGLNYPVDVAVDSSSDVYVSEMSDFTIRKYSSAGADKGIFAGTSGVPYLTNNTLLNTPSGIAIAADGSIYASEHIGMRLIKLNPAGSQVWTIGQPGVEGSDNYHFNWPRGNPAIDAAGRIYVTDSGRHRVQIYNPDATYFTTMGIPGERGSDNQHFYRPNGIAISPVNGDIYVADRYNHRVQVFHSNRTYKTTLGVSGVSGSNNNHFDQPHGVAVDSSGNVYVADTDNNRVQVFNSSHTYQRTIGITGKCEWGDFDHLCEPFAVAVDRLDRLYVADTRTRVQVFDSSGAYLTTIGGGWGSGTGEMRNAMGVAVDNAGNVYVTDESNHRIQKFAPGLPDWVQSNINGFGDAHNNLITALSPFKGNLYSGTANWEVNGAQLWRKNGAAGWTSVMKNGFGNSANLAINHLFEFKNDFYAATWADETNGGEVWRSSSGDSGSWSKVVSSGFGDTTNGELFHLAEFNNRIYASTVSYTDTHGTEIWRSSSGDSGSWSRVVNDGFDGDSDNVIAMSLEVFNGYMYAGTYNWGTGTEIWRSSNGDSGSWGKVNTDGFGDQYNFYISLNTFNGYLYAGTYNYSDSDNPGAELWRCQTCAGADWTEVSISKGFGDTENRAIRSLVILNDALYAFTYNRTTGIEVWRSNNGIDWEQVNIDGFGDSLNYAPYWDNSTTVFNNALYVGTWNNGHGGEVWEYLGKRIFLPLTMR